MDGSFLIYSVGCLIQIYQVYKGASPKRFGYYFAIAFLLSSLVYLATLMTYLYRNFPLLTRPEMKKKVGAAYEGFAMKRAGRYVILFSVFSYLRRIALSLIVTFGRDSTEAQRIFMNFGSVFMLAFTGYVRPHFTHWPNRLEMANEYTILLLYCLCITQTDFVERVDGRYWMGWGIIVVIIVNILLNFSSIAAGDIGNAYRRLKFRWIRRRKLKALIIKQAERREAIQHSMLLKTAAQTSTLVEAKLVIKKSASD